MPYKIADGLNVPLLSLANIVIQPRSSGMKYARRSYSASGVVLDEGPYIEHLYSSLGWNTSRYRTLLTQHGLLAATTNEVTVYSQDDLFNWVRFNALAVRPKIGDDGQRDGVFLKNFVILFKNLRNAS